MYFVIMILGIFAGIAWARTYKSVKEYSTFWILAWFFLWASPIAVVIAYAAQNLSRAGYFTAMLVLGIVFAVTHLIGIFAALADSK